MEMTSPMGVSCPFCGRDVSCTSEELYNWAVKKGEVATIKISCSCGLSMETNTSGEYSDELFRLRKKWRSIPLSELAIARRDYCKLMEKFETEIC